MTTKTIDHFQIKLSGDDKQLQRTMKRIAKNFKSIGKTISKGLLAGGGIAAGFGVAAKSSVELADSIAKAARAAGIGTDTLQELRHAAVLTGAGMKQLDDGVRRFNRRFGEAKAGRGFVKDFEILLGGANQFSNIQEALEAALIALGNVKDSAERAALASRVFGDDAGPKLALMVGQGTDALADMRKEAHDLGLVIKSDLLGSAESIGDTFSIIGAQIRTSLATGILANADAIQAFASQVSEAIPKVLDGATAFAEFFGVFSDTKQGRLNKIDRDIAAINDTVFALPGMPGPDKKTPQGAHGVHPGLRRFDPKSPRGRAMLQNLEELKRERIQLVDAIAAEKAEWDATMKRMDDLRNKIAEGLTGSLQGPSNGDGGAQPAKLFADGFDVGAWVADWKRGLQELEQPLSDIEASFKETFIGLGNVFADFIQSGRDGFDSLKNWAATAADSILRSFMNEAFTGLFKAIFPNYGQGGGIASFLGGKAGGGRISGPTLVGERGMEIVDPGGPATVYNAADTRRMLGGGISVPQVIHNHFDVSLDSVDSRIAQAVPKIAKASMAGVSDAIQRGGSGRKAFGR